MKKLLFVALLFFKSSFVIAGDFYECSGFSKIKNSELKIGIDMEFYGVIY